MEHLSDGNMGHSSRLTVYQSILASLFRSRATWLFVVLYAIAALALFIIGDGTFLLQYNRTRARRV